MGVAFRPPVAGMHVVAIQHGLSRHHGRPHVPDERVRALADATGVTFYELRTRLRLLDGWPGVLTTFAGEEPARAVVLALAREGVAAWVLPGEAAQPRALVRRFSLVDGWLTAELDGGTVQIAAADVRALVHAVHLGEQREVELSRPAVSHVPRAALWAAPVLGLTRPRLRVRPTAEPFVELHAPGLPILSFRSSALRYAAFEHGLVEPTRTANFSRVVRTLRQGCPQASYDGRLRRRMEQARVLGPTLRPERYLSLALRLLSPGMTSSPYR